MLKTFKNHLNENLKYLAKSNLLLAVSGGLDSVALTHLCKNLKLKITLAHCNFNLRTTESDLDEDFVRKLAKTLGLEIFVERFDTTSYASVNKLSTQMAARKLRYDWFNELIIKNDFDFILTAHHSDDNLETFLINLSRGTGLEGLMGIPERNENIIRPLLPFSRLEIKNYAEEEGISWREDSSNASTKYLRNKLRHDVIPQLKSTNSHLLENFKQTLSNLKDTANIVEESVKAVLKRAVIESTAEETTYRIEAFRELNNPKAYLFQVFKTYNFTEWEDVLSLLDAQSGKKIWSKTHQLLKNRDQLVLTRLNPTNKDQPILISHDQAIVGFGSGTLTIENTIGKLKPEWNEIHIDKELLKFPLVLRNWKEGDYFYPKGMLGKKKLSKYFKDEKLSIIDKEKVKLLCSQNDIVWVVGKRQDRRFEVTPQTKNILKITLK